MALDPPDGLLIDVTGVAHLFGGEAALHEAVLAHFRRAGFATQAALAGTPDAARGTPMSVTAFSMAGSVARLDCVDTANACAGSAARANRATPTRDPAAATR